MDFDLSQDQKLLVDTASSFAKKESPVGRMRRLRDDALGYERDTWRKMGELGWLGVLYPEDVGGFGGSFVDAALIVQELATTLVPEPYLASVLVAGMAIQLAGDDTQRKRWLAPMIQGTSTLALAWAEDAGRYDPYRVDTRAERHGGSFRLTGKKTFVLEGHAADAIVVSARTSGGPGDRDGVSLFVVDPTATALAVRPIKTMDGRRAATIALNGVEAHPERLLGAEGKAGPILEHVLDLGAAAACAEGAGIMRTVLAMTVDYLKTREQFGVKIGTFQALQHRAVDMFVQTELAKSTALLAALKVMAPDPVERKGAVSAAKVQLATSGRFVTQQAIQLHGGIGVTDEHDVGLYFKRMHVLNSLFGDEESHVERYSRLPSFVEGI